MCGILKTKDDTRIHSIDHRGIETGKREHNGFLYVHRRLPIQTIAGDDYSQPYDIGGGKFFLFNGELFDYPGIEKYENDVQYLAEFFRRFGDMKKLSSSEAIGEMNQWDGFWAIVLVDRKRKTEIVFTDPLGKKQLYYNSETEICSEIGPLINTKVLDETYFSTVSKFGYNYDDATPYRSIKRFMPNNIYELDSKRKKVAVHYKYFDFDKYPKKNNLYELIDASVRSRLVSKTYPVSLLLSGGLDSTIILHHLAESKKASAINIYSIDNDEREYVELCETYFGIKVNYLSYNMAELSDEQLSEIYMINETPVDLGSVVPQFTMMKNVKDTIVLTGDGLDELCGGYRRIHEYDSQRSDIFQELPFYHFPRLDRASMRYTKELRSPFTSHDIVRKALKLPFADRTDKKILKDIYVGKIPDQIIDRKKHALKNSSIVSDAIAYRHKIVKLFKQGVMNEDI